MEDTLVLYRLLNIEKNATQELIKKSYRQLALKFHPDKNQGDCEAKEKFQKISEAYKILIDPEKRKIYDETGTIEDGLEQFHEAYQFYRNLFPKITKQDIEDFEKKYRFGQMEEEDLISFYNEFKGDLTTILENIPLSKNEDINRFIAFYQQQIADKKLKKYKAFEKTQNSIHLLEDESIEAEEEEMNIKQLSQNILAKRALSNEQLISSLEQKYGQKPKKNNTQKQDKKKKLVKKQKK